MIRTKVQLVEKRKVILSDEAPTYIFEAVGDDVVQLGKIKLRVRGERQQRILRNNDFFNVTITPAASED